METMRFLEEWTGESWVGIQFHFQPIFGPKMTHPPTRLCEAIYRALDETFTCSVEMIQCPGACRSLGVQASDVEELATSMFEKSGTPKEAARRIISQVPRLHFTPTAITLGKVPSPDVLVSFISPQGAMKLVRLWQEVHGAAMETTLSTFMGVCGHVAVKAFNTRQPALSFGCPASRKTLKMGDEKMVFGMPYSLAATLPSSMSTSAVPNLISSSS